MKPLERLAREAGFEVDEDGVFAACGPGLHDPVECSDMLRRFAALIAEQCARECDLVADSYWVGDGAAAAQSCADGIRDKFDNAKEL